MYLTLISVLLALAVGVGSWLLDAGWFGGVFFGLIAFVATWFVGGRMIRRRLEPALQQVQRQIEAGMAQAALATLKGMLPLGNWVPLLRGQLFAQMGVLANHTGDTANALAWLQQAGRRAGDAQLLLACIRFRDGKKDEAFTLLERATPFNRKHALLHNVRAWLLNREGKRDQAIAVLNDLIKKNPHDASKDNLLRLQNDQKMNMKSFGLAWYALGFEQPPRSMGEMRTARKGFRQPPKRRGS